MFVDFAKITIIAGDGGNGKVSFRREKFVPSGGPDGGDGGNGGSIVFVVDNNMSTLMDFRYKRKYVAQNGENGGSRNCSGKNAENLVIKVPKGTVIKEAITGNVIKDMSDSREFTVAKGGVGGWGNAKFATPTRQAPHFARAGGKGEKLDIILELKLLADVALVGFPNVGKSTLLASISSARPKIANYHFTTLKPNLGVVYIDEGQSFVMADVPGLIEGAAEGAGLGHSFLRHVERSRLIVHIVDGSGSEGRNPVEDFKLINNELQKYSPELAKRPQILVASKSDLFDQNPENIKLISEFAKENNIELFKISAPLHDGLDELKFAIWNKLKELPPIEIFEPQYVVVKEDENIIDIEKENGIYYVTGSKIENIVRSINFEDYESRMYFERALRKAGVYELLEQKGVQEGDIIDIYGHSFDYVP